MPEIDAILGGAPPPSAPAATESKFIGVPDGYQFAPPVDRESPYGKPSGAAPPQYKTGEQYAPASMSVEARARLQEMLAKAGLIGPGSKFRIGVWDETSVGAYRDLLAYSNQNGVDWRTGLDQLASSPRQSPKDLGITPPDEVEAAKPPGFRERPIYETRLNTVELADPVGLGQAADDAWVAAHGKKPTARQRAQFIKTFQAMDSARQRKPAAARDKLTAEARGREEQERFAENAHNGYDAAGNWSGAVKDGPAPVSGGSQLPISQNLTTVGVDVGAQAEQAAIASDPNGATAHTAATKVFGNFLQMLGGVT